MFGKHKAPLKQTRPSPPAIYKSILNVWNWDAWVIKCDRLFLVRAGLNEIFSTIDIDRINPPLQILDGFYRFEFNLDNDNLFWF
jgi:hypothetical protein